jgi:hypothetical protein
MKIMIRKRIRRKMKIKRRIILADPNLTLYLALNPLHDHNLHPALTPLFGLPGGKQEEKRLG